MNNIIVITQATNKNRSWPDTVSAISQLTMMWLDCIAINAMIIHAMIITYGSAFDGRRHNAWIGMAAVWKLAHWPYWKHLISASQSEENLFCQFLFFLYIKYSIRRCNVWIISIDIVNHSFFNKSSTSSSNSSFSTKWPRLGSSWYSDCSCCATNLCSAMGTRWSSGEAYCRMNVQFSRMAWKFHGREKYSASISLGTPKSVW